ncbi:MAG TPA: hypothetical protein VFV07_08800 [Rhizomicrobium sp.]|nr:hypothetical protein [Rhizomicrobium sp.]
MDSRTQSDLHAVLGTLEDGLVKVVQVSPDRAHVEVAQRYLEETLRIRTLVATSQALTLSDPSLSQARSLAANVTAKVAGSDTMGALREARLALSSLRGMASLDGEPIFTGGGSLPPPP